MLVGLIRALLLAPDISNPAMAFVSVPPERCHAVGSFFTAFLLGGCLTMLLSLGKGMTVNCRLVSLASDVGTSLYPLGADHCSFTNNQR